MKIDHLEEDLNLNKVPSCRSCFGLVKSDVILFGEPLPVDTADLAFSSAQHCDLLIMVGSSLTVQPANLIPQMAKFSGSKLIFINKESTPFDHLADVILRGSAGVILPTLLKRFKEKMATKIKEEN